MRGKLRSGPWSGFDSGGMGNVALCNYFFVRSLNEVDAEVLDFKSPLAAKVGPPAGNPGPIFGCSAGPVSDTGAPQPEGPQRPSSKTAMVWQVSDRNFMLPPH